MYLLNPHRYLLIQPLMHPLTPPPPPLSHIRYLFYREGAGNEVVNGLYTMSSGGTGVNGGDGVTYQKQPATPEEPLLTLFRCTMRTKSKWYVVHVCT